MGEEGDGFEGLQEVQSVIIIPTFPSIAYLSFCFNVTFSAELIYIVLTDNNLSFFMF